MGLTKNLGTLAQGVFSDSSLNIGIGGAPSGSFKFEVTGSGKVSGQLTLGSTITNGTYTYTLPGATGTLALTSDLGAYLPLTGGTLTGALSGTSATFSGKGAIGGSAINTMTPYSQLTVGSTGLTNAGLTIASSNASSGLIEFADGTTGNEAYRGYIQYNHQTDSLIFATAASDRVSISSTGAATFSGDLTANVGTITFTNAANVYMPSIIRNGATGKAFFQYDGTDTRLLKLSTGLWSVRNDANNANLLTITDAGAATFSSTVTAPTFVGALTGTASGNVVLRTQSNWNDSTVINNVVGLLAWKNYGNGHVIFDASQGTSPSGTSVNNTNSQIAWSALYPTLMGWNGGNTYGVRVDSARVADSATTATYATNSTRLYATDNPYCYGCAAPYYMYMTYDGTRWFLQVSPASPSAVRVSYADGAGNADTVDGYHASTSTIANGIVVRDANGYIFGNYLNMTDDGNPGAGTAITSFITKQGDNYYRSVSPTNAMVSIRGVASGSWGISITGNAASETLATVTNRGNSTAQNVVFSNGRKGLIGVYDPAQTQAIFAMGAAYILTDGGASSNIGNLYGLAWSYNPDYGGAGNNPQSKAGLNHQLLHMQNGITTTAIGSGIWTSGNVTAPTFIGALTGNASTATTTTGNAGSVTYLLNRTDSAAYQVLWGAPYSNGIGTLAYSCAAVTITSSTGTLTATTLIGSSDVRAPIFYDSNDTTKYLQRNTSSYTSWYMGGANNGYSGWNVDGGMHLMMHTGGVGGPCGLFHVSVGWSILTYANADQRLYSNGAEKIATIGDGGYITGNLYVTGNVYANYSDIRLKKDVEVIKGAISKIKQLRGVTYTWNNEQVNILKERAGIRDIGLIAQEVQSIEPLLTEEYTTRLNTPSKDPKEAENFISEVSEAYMTVKYEKLVALLVEGIKEQQLQIEELKQSINNLSN
jgi:hypothetical protein